MPRNEEWEKNLEIDDLQYKSVSGEGILLKLLGKGIGANARNPLGLGQALFALRTLAAYLDRNTPKDKPKQYQWILDMCDRAEDHQGGLSAATNYRDDVLTAYVFQQWNENAKSKPNIDVSTIPEPVNKAKG